MTQFIIIYQGGEKPATKEEGMAMRADWQRWMENLGSAIVNPGSPLGPSMLITSEGITEGGGVNAISGYTIVDVEDQDQALSMAKDCPHIEMKGASLVVAEIMSMT